MTDAMDLSPHTIKIPKLKILSNRERPHALPKWSSSGALLTTRAPARMPNIDPRSNLPSITLMESPVAPSPAPFRPAPFMKQPTSDGIMNVGWRTKQPINALVESTKRQKFSSASSSSGRGSAYNSPRSTSSTSSMSSMGSNASGFGMRQSLSELKRGAKRSMNPSDEARRHLSMRAHLPPLMYDAFLGVDEFEDDLLSYTTEDVIGEGGQGKIVKSRVRDRDVALKISEDDVILAEFHIATKFSHPNVLKPIGFSCVKVETGSARSDSDRSSFSPRSNASYTNNAVWVYMAAYELCDHGDLASFLFKNPEIRSDVVAMARIFDQILAGLEHIHSRGYLHTDIKPENILITQDLQVKVGDFGMCQAFSSKMIAQGTPSFMSPEIVYSWFTPKNPHRFSAAADVFSFGCLVAYAVTDKYPFHRITARLKRGIQIPWDFLKVQYTIPPSRMEELSSISPEMASVVRQCLCLNELERPSVAFLRSYINSKLVNKWDSSSISSTSSRGFAQKPFQ
eukprot:TRINITY_DN1475_c0_g1_i1.p1 TRINITY_DN1475_c0_g1~~TRINITY_DN1475_c0_g1_i1.p1  ORF type:complete len:511 (+),score=59.20 TRINITY_DN1475_c0_g1_i1:202-1734(+)